MARNGLRSILILLCCGLMACAHTKGADAGAAGRSGAEATGVVFIDANHNGVRDTGERGLAGVAVSNQTVVVKTDAQGRYRLPVDDETIIFISQPAGYAPPLSEDNLPRFYYIHQPAGSPAKLGGKGLAPTGPLPAAIDFALNPVDQPESFNVAVLGDPQLYTRADVGYFAEDIVSELIAADARFILTLGDLVGEKPELYPPYKQTLAQAGKAVYNTSGNHDEDYELPDDHYALETYKRHFGPPYYSFNFGKVHFIVLDSVCWSRPEGRDGYYIGKLGERQLTWLKNDLALVPQDRLVVLASHIPFVNASATGGGSTINDREAAFALLQDRPHLLALAGHNHSIEQYQSGAEIGWHGVIPFHQIVCGATCGAWWTGPKDARGIPIADMNDGSPNGYYMVHFEGTRYSSRYKVANADPALRMRISAPTAALDDATCTRAVVNVFDGGPQTRVECAIDGGTWQPMTLALIPDPFMDRLYDSGRATIPYWKDIKAEPSLHIWTAPLPALPPGSLHRLTVRVTEPDREASEMVRIFKASPAPR